MERLSREDALCAALPLLSPMALSVELATLLLLRLVEVVRGGCTAEAEADEEVSWRSLFVGGLMRGKEKRRERNECQI